MSSSDRRWEQFSKRRVVVIDKFKQKLFWSGINPKIIERPVYSNSQCFLLNFFFAKLRPISFPPFFLFSFVNSNAGVWFFFSIFLLSLDKLYFWMTKKCWYKLVKYFSCLIVPRNEKRIFVKVIVFIIASQTPRKRRNIRKPAQRLI